MPPVQIGNYILQMCGYSEYPYVEGEPELSTRYNDNTSEFLFTCDFFATKRDGVLYFITWLHGNNSVRTVPVFTESGTEALNSDLIPEIVYNSQVKFLM